MIVTAKQLEDLHRQNGNNGRLTLPYRARLTPLAMDWVKAKKVVLGYSDAETARETSARLVDLIAGSEFRHNGNALPLSVAIGAAEIDGEDTPETVMARADAEMYRRKAAA